jgi:hypothetical protein
MAAPSAVGDHPALLPAHESAEQLRRLRYILSKLTRIRHPLCGINGILAMLPFESIQSDPREAAELEQAVKADLLVAQRTLELQAPVTALIVGLEKESGFSEMVRRVGRERAAAQRFGRRFDIRSIPTPEELTALCAPVCGAFEDWVYTLFREEGALTRPGNTRLYGLLCKVRCNLKGRLAAILAHGFGYDAQLQSSDDPIAFSGCYFAATGETEDRQAFVRGVLDKQEEEQEDVEWTTRALANNRRYVLLASAGFALSAVLLVTLAGMLIYGW